MNICEYGCGQEGKYQFKNGKWRCSQYLSQCPANKEKNKISNKGKIRKRIYKPLILNEDEKKLCDYGCGHRAKYQFRNGKICCNSSLKRCPKVKDNTSKNEKVAYVGDELCIFGCGQKANFKFKNGNLCCSEHSGKCPIIKLKNRNSNLNQKRSEECKEKQKGRIPWNKNKKDCFSKEVLKKMSDAKQGKYDGENNPAYGKPGYWRDKRRPEHSRIMMGHPGYWTNKSFTIKHKTNISNSQYRTIEQWKEKYPTFGKEEEMRYNPDKPMEEKEIQVHCKNSNCENSKEMGGWFTPTRYQISSRAWQIEKETGNDGSYLYCSQHCKDTCPLYGSRGKDPYGDIIMSYSQSELGVVRQITFKRDKCQCQICEKFQSELIDPLQCHHIYPVKTYPEYALDADTCITICKECHDKVHSGNDKDCSKGGLANKVCKK